MNKFSTISPYLLNFSCPSLHIAYGSTEFVGWLGVQLSTYADNVALPAFARHMKLLQQLIDISCWLGPQQQTCRSKKSGFAKAAGLLLWAHAGTDRQTPYRFTDPAPHTMQAVLTTQWYYLGSISAICSIMRFGRTYLKHTAEICIKDHKLQHSHCQLIQHFCHVPLYTS